MSAITAVQSPPQTVETLDPWGNTDAIPFSFDSPIWDTAGVYSLSVGGAASGTESFSGVCARSPVEMYGRAYGVESIAGKVNRGLQCPGSELSAENLASVRIRTGDSIFIVFALEDAFNLWSVRKFSGADSVQSFESFVSEYKGWDWSLLSGVNAEWRGVVQWQ